ncbi:MAG: hypothetical protein KF832_07595 [Caldilineaceae bacterium]|nr:hypothetical protein [Caldilineaceae bacterium]
MDWQEWQAYADNEQNWVDHDERGLLKAEYVCDYVLRLWFEEELDVSIYELDFQPLFVEHNPGGVFQPLRNQDRFRLVEGNYSLNWLNPRTGLYDETAIDLAPECVRFFCERYGRTLKSADRPSTKELVTAATELERSLVVG